ncbi:YfcC family protein [Hymenobacter negativus]|uniref:YfcC family protein n=1 Tax=Hymenobacter negativus TaxID=2795026 RepID=A0ABS3QBI2_9BACT|nr:YfcC family protein [Hymenobacter negativus]MBO2008184.1 YfcC family protein [Hymenobacter negativus]
MNTFRFPHPLVLLVGFIILAAALSYVLPAGQFARQKSAQADGREVVVPGSYQRVPATPVSPLDMLVDIPKGMADAAGVIFLIFLAGGAFTVLDQTGALRHGVDWLLARAHGREVLVIPVVSLLFATMGALENMGEEVVPLIPVLLVLMRRLGYPVITAVAASLGAAIVGAAFSPINPFQVGIAQKLALLPLLSGGGFRLALLLPAVGLWIAGTMRHATRHRIAPDVTTEENVTAEEVAPEATGTQIPKSTGWLMLAASVWFFYPLAASLLQVHTEIGVIAAAASFLSFALGIYILIKGLNREAAVLLLLLACFSIFGYGVVRLGWDFDQMGALFFVLGVGAGLLGGMGLSGTAEGFVTGFRDIAFSALLIGFARAIFVVLEQGHIVDTIVQGMSAPLAHLPVTLSALGMMVVQTALHLPVPSVSGQATLTMPLFAPLADLIGMSRQVVVLCFQYAAGLCELITPTNGSLLAILAICGIRFDQWLRFVGPLYALLLGLGVVGVVAAIWLGV